jgi:hypothetical protein
VLGFGVIVPGLLARYGYGGADGDILFRHTLDVYRPTEVGGRRFWRRPIPVGTVGIAPGGGCGANQLRPDGVGAFSGYRHFALC